MTCIILAAGKGTRMKSKYPKVLHKILDIPIISWVVETSKKLNPEKIIVITGYKAELVEKVLPDEVVCVRQEEQLGTGHAVKTAYNFIPDDEILILNGDVPFIDEKTIHEFMKFREENGYQAAILSMVLKDPAHYGRIIHKENKIEIKEFRDVVDEEKMINEVNSGIYCFDGKFLKKALKNLKNNNDQNEFYLTDTLDMAKRSGAMTVEDNFQVLGINDRKELIKMNHAIKSRINNELIENGVTILDPENTWIGPNVKIGMDTVIYPFTYITGNTEIGEDCIIGPMTRLHESTLQNNVIVQRSEVEFSKVMRNVSIGPWSRLRKENVIEENVKIGDFVELKKAHIGKNSKAQHLSYLGDATLGENVNIGAGTITCNYDGKNKFKTNIGDEAFIGSNSSLVAPVNVGKSSLVGAGSVITEDVPDYSLALGRGRQINKRGRIKK
jgi:bifunctional UDP-N-acetylglucosamine pyrophosphorylase/glucosamine-1-phosphate N-acetyltransferase